MKAFIIGIVALLVIVGGGYLVIHKPSTSKAPVTNSAVTQNAPDIISFDGNGFTPAELTVKNGTTVTVKNNSSQEMQMDSNPHPAHTDDTDLNVGLVAPGQSMTFIATKTGSFGYHDHLSPGIQGKITVQ